MSVPRRTFTLTRKAQTDFAGIMAYTVEHWGAHQRDIYAEKLLAGFDTIARFPEIGKDRFDITPGVFSHHIEQHVVYCRFTATRLRVLRLRHVRADAVRPSCERLDTPAAHNGTWLLIVCHRFHDLPLFWHGGGWAGVPGSV